MYHSPSGYGIPGGEGDEVGKTVTGDRRNMVKTVHFKRLPPRQSPVLQREVERNEHADAPRVNPRPRRAAFIDKARIVVEQTLASLATVEGVVVEIDDGRIKPFGGTHNDLGVQSFRPQPDC